MAIFQSAFVLSKANFSPEHWISYFSGFQSLFVTANHTISLNIISSWQADLPYDLGNSLGPYLDA